MNAESVKKVRKRDGRVVDFEPGKIANAIHKALNATNTPDGKLAASLAEEVTKRLDEKAKENPLPSVEEIQDVVERVLIDKDLPEVAKAYILYREMRANVRATRKFVGVAPDEIKVGINAAKVLSQRYLIKDEKGKVVETPAQLFRRVATAIAAADLLYDKQADIKTLEDTFYKMMANFEFLPNSPTLMNAGTSINQLAACFVIPVDDSIPAIFDAVKYMAIIHQSGGGTGFSFSRLRPKGDIVKSTKGIASGPVSFMRVFDTATDVIKQGGRRRGANMGILRHNHPDIIEFVTAKKKEDFLSNFNVSVAITDGFMEALSKEEDFELINPRSGEVTGKLSAKYLFDLIVASAWSTGDPGLFFIDRANAINPTPQIGQFESTNPCVVGSTRISTSEGLLTMEELFVSQEAFAALTVVTGTSAGSFGRETALFPAVPVFKTGSNEPVSRLETGHGYELTATANHRFLTPDGFTELKDLKPGDMLYLQAGEGSWSEAYELPPFVPDHPTAKGRYLSGVSKGKINPPQKWSRELGQLMGWIVGDGFLTSDSGRQMVALTFGEEDLDFIQYFRTLFDNWFGATGFLRKQRGSVQLRYKGFPARFLSNLGIEAVKSHLKKVPDSIWRAPREAVIGFLQGLFTTDGTVNLSEKKGSCNIRLASSSKTLLQEVQLLLLNLGIVSRLHLRREDGEVYLPGSDGKPKLTKACKQYELLIDKVNRDLFIETVGFMSEAKQLKAKSFIESKKRKSNRETFTTKVKSIEPAGFADVYDTTQPVTHTVSYNGIITHQCGEVPLLPYEPCNLGSINLHKMINNGKVDWNKLRETVHLSTHFLDNVIDAGKYPLPQIDYMAKANRKIGLGVMGFAELLLEMGIPYDSQAALDVAEEVMSFIYEEALKASVGLAKKRGSFPNFKESKWDEAGYGMMRNATVTTVAPTGTISIIAATSSGIEPLFAVSYAREVMEGTTLLEVNPVFERIAKERGFYSKELMLEISKRGSVQALEQIPEDVRRLFVTSLDIEPEWHVRMQAVFQQYVDNAVSKTVNLPEDATLEDVRNIYLLAYELKCKGITVYRYGSKKEQVLYIGKPEDRKVMEQPVTAASEYSGGCAWGFCPL